ncbi:MAG: hypothetical protein HOK97_00670 [Deltaproteobacteria bacterium]|nr:hypothetical protein [Deltaproteobacteria bacterium]MBT6488245.1 hypothetical protein [Deltaproteobacteria bacterium]
MLRLCLIGLYASVFVLTTGCGSRPAPVLVSTTEISPQLPQVLADASAIEHMLEGERFFLQKRYKPAADYFRLALVHDPHSVHLYLRLAQALGKANAWLAALQVLEKAQTSCSGHPKVRLALGKLYLETDDYEAVERLLQPAEFESEDYARALLIRLDASLWRRRPALVQDIEELVLQEFPDMRCMIGALLEDHGFDKRALAHYELCSSQLSLVRSRLGFRQSGAALSNEFKTVPVAREMNLQPLSGVSSSKELSKEGVELRRAHRLRSGDCEVLYQLGGWYKLKEDKGRSLRYIEEAFRRCGDHPSIAIALARAYGTRGNWDRARELSQQILEGDYTSEVMSAAKKIIERSYRVQAEE